MANSYVFGPFDIPAPKGKGGGKYIKEDLTDFWDGCGEEIRNGMGCYVFAVRAGKGITPIYVGNTVKYFECECFADHKLKHYHNALKNYQRGTPVMFFILHKSRSDAGKKEIKEIEGYLIHAGATANPNLSNVKKRKGQSWGINGVIRSDKNKNTFDAQAFCKMMKIRTVS